MTASRTTQIDVQIVSKQKPISSPLRHFEDAAAIVARTTVASESIPNPPEPNHRQIANPRLTTHRPISKLLRSGSIIVMNPASQQPSQKHSQSGKPYNKRVSRSRRPPAFTGQPARSGSVSMVVIRLNKSDAICHCSPRQQRRYT